MGEGLNWPSLSFYGEDEFMAREKFIPRQLPTAPPTIAKQAHNGVGLAGPMAVQPEQPENTIPLAQDVYDFLYSFSNGSFEIL